MSWPPPNYNPAHGTGYTITLQDFRQIISDPAWQDIARPLLREWFGYEIRGNRDGAKVVSATGSAIDLAGLHAQIQGDAKRQYEMYQRAMSVWR